jgi:hypothetical protein
VDDAGGAAAVHDVAIDHDETQADPRAARLLASVQHALRVVGPAEGGTERFTSDDPARRVS